MQFVIVALALAVIGVLVIGGLVVLMRGERGKSPSITPGEPNTLSHVVPEGQDPATVLAAVRRAGFEARIAQGATGEEVVVVACRGGVDERREEVRAAIADAGRNPEGDPSPTGPVTFTDE